MSTTASTKALGELACSEVEIRTERDLEISSGFVTGLFGLFCWELLLTSWYCEVRALLVARCAEN